MTKEESFNKFKEESWPNIPCSGDFYAGWDARQKEVDELKKRYDILRNLYNYEQSDL